MMTCCAERRCVNVAYCRQTGGRWTTTTLKARSTKGFKRGRNNHCWGHVVGPVVDTAAVAWSMSEIIWLTAVAVGQQDDTLQRAELCLSVPPPPLKMWDLLTGSTLPQLIYVIVFSCVVWLLLSRRLPSKREPSLRSVAILVLGDVGRSPRMMYHAESFAKLQFETFLVGYKGMCAL